MPGHRSRHETLRNAVMRPIHTQLTTLKGTFPLTKLDANANNYAESHSVSRRGIKWSVMPDGPVAALRLDDLKFNRNCSPTRMGGRDRAFQMSSGTGLRGAGGRLFSSRSWFKESRELLPIGPTSEPLLHDDSYRLPAAGASVGRRLLNLAQRSACSVSPNAPNLHGRTSNCFRGTLPPRGGRNKIILGRSMHNAHARWTLMKSPFASKTTRNAALNAPLRNTGTVRITTARRRNLAYVNHVQTHHPHRNCPCPHVDVNGLCRPPQHACFGHLTHARCC